MRRQIRLPPIQEPRAHLLQMLDEMYRGYQDSRYVLDTAGLVPRGREAAMGMALVDGQLLAWMKRTLGKDRVDFALTPLRELGRRRGRRAGRGGGAVRRVPGSPRTPHPVMRAELVEVRRRWPFVRLRAR